MKKKKGVGNPIISVVGQSDGPLSASYAKKKKGREQSTQMGKEQQRKNKEAFKPNLPFQQDLRRTDNKLVHSMASLLQDLIRRHMQLVA